MNTIRFFNDIWELQSNNVNRIEILESKDRRRTQMFKAIILQESIKEREIILHQFSSYIIDHHFYIYAQPSFFFFFRIANYVSLYLNQLYYAKCIFFISYFEILQYVKSIGHVLCNCGDAHNYWDAFIIEDH